MSQAKVYHVGKKTRNPSYEKAIIVAIMVGLGAWAADELFVTTVTEQGKVIDSSWAGKHSRKYDVLIEDGPHKGQLVRGKREASFTWDTQIDNGTPVTIDVGEGRLSGHVYGHSVRPKGP